MKEKIKLTLRDYVRAGNSGIIYKTNEEARAIDEAYIVAKLTGRRLIVWSETRGIIEYKSIQIDGEIDSSKYADDEYTLNMENYETKKHISGKELVPDEGVLVKGLDFDKNGKFIFVLLDYHPIINTPVVWRTAKDCFEIASTKEVSFVFVSSVFDVPKELEHYVAVLEMDLPRKNLLTQLARDLVKNCIEEHSKDDDFSMEVSDEDIKDAAEAAKGLTLIEAADAMAMALYKTLSLDVNIINDVKRDKICKDGLLKYTESNNESLETVGGMKAFTGFVQEKLSGFSEEAREENIPYPKGVLLVGIPGCGKSLAAKALANMWKKPLLQLDMGKMFGSYVGESEERMRDTLKLAEAMEPCILWVDEIEKGLSGISSSGSTDSGVTSRLFGTFLTWLQEKDKAVFVIATANSISNLPDELLRKGRFDEIFFVDLPDLEERKEIFEIQIKKYQGKKYNVTAYQNSEEGKDGVFIDELANLTEGFSGAEIESVITTAKQRAFNEGRSYNMDDLRNIISETHPAAKGFMEPTVNMLREWRDRNNIRSANIPHSVSPIGNNDNTVTKMSKRKISIG